MARHRIEGDKVRRKTLGILLPITVIAGAVAGGGLFVATAGAAQPTPVFHQCPPVGFDTGCQILIWIDPTGTVHFLSDPNQATFNGSEDTLVGVQNDSNSTISAITLSGTGTNSQGQAVGDFAFDQDGLCSGDNESGGSGFQAPPAGCPFDSTGYAGSGDTFSNISANGQQGTVNFTTSVQSGGSAYFSLEGNIDTANLHIVKASPTLTTVTPSTAAFGSTLSDTATLAGATAPTGQVTFSLYNNQQCTGTPVYSNAVDVGDGQNLASGNTGTNLAPGLYEWVATYPGDVNNNKATSGCGTEPVTVGQAAPMLDTSATVSATAGSAISDSATLTGGSSPTGAVTFQAFGPNNASCTGSAAYTSVSVTVTGDGTVNASPTFTPAAAGTYQWVATYSGDANNASVIHACGSAHESSMVMMAALANPTVTTTAHGAGPLGPTNTISDTAFLKGGNNPQGTINFAVYGPGDTNCNTPLTTLHATANGNGTYQSGPYTPTAVGTYRFVASYGGDNANNPAHTTCGDTGESVAMTKAHPTLTTNASLTGSSTADVGHLAGGVNPTGTIHFNLYGPNPSTCTQSMGASDDQVTGNGNYNAAPVTISAPGNYTWVATYTGDPNNAPVTVSGCGTDPNETVNLNKAHVTITTQATQRVTQGSNIHDIATVAGGNNPTGTLQFNLYGPGDTNCTQASFYSPAPVAVNGDGSNYSSGDYTAVVPGTYRWTVSYSGDGNNLPALSPCNAPNESTQVVPTIMTGRAYALKAQVNVLGILGVDIPAVADTGHIETPDASQTAPCTVVTTGLIQATVLCGSVVTSTHPEDHSVAQAHVANVTVHLGQLVNLLNLGDITADVIDTTSTTSCDGSHGDTTIANLRIGGVLHALVTVAPNTGIEIEPGIELELNEQEPVPGGLEVNALHLRVDLLGIKADVIVASATSDIHNCP